MARVCISAGHGLSSRTPGNIDPGAVANHRQESVGTLGMAKRLAEDFAVLGIWCLLRDTGHYSRADDDAAKAACDIFVELHFNAGPKAANGTETLYHPSGPAGSKNLARSIQARLHAALGTADRGVKARTDLAVLTPHAPMKACLVESHFTTNAIDVTRWDAHVDDAEKAILNGILVMLGRPEVKSLPRQWSAVRRALHYLRGKVV